MDDLKILNS